MSKFSRKQLEELVQEKIIDEAAAEKILNFYQKQKPESQGRLATVLGILGALLAGLGIILVVAHNWDDLDKNLKTGLSFLPLLLGQFLCLYTYFKRHSSVAWREISAVITFFGVGSSISLIAQLYHIDGKLSEFLLTWILLTLPLVYLMRSSVTALLAIAAATWYACEIGYGYRSPQLPILYVAFLAFLIPHYSSVKKDKSNFYHLLNWTLSISIIIVLGSFNGRYSVDERWLLYCYLALFCAYYLFGKTSEFQSQPLWANPFRILGQIGILFLLFMSSFEFIWEWSSRRFVPIQSPIFYISLILSAIALFLAVKVKIFKTFKSTDPIGLSFITYLLALLVSRQVNNSAEFLINIWILAIAVYYMNRGVEENHLGILNFGLLVIMILAICRFFDYQIPFVWRGIFFLATGICFFAANYFLLKKRKKSSALINR